MWIAAFSDTDIIRIFSQITYVYLIRVFSEGQILCSTQSEAEASHSDRRVRYITYYLMMIMFHSSRLHKHLKLKVIKKNKNKKNLDNDLFSFCSQYLRRKPCRSKLLWLYVKQRSRWTNWLRICFHHVGEELLLSCWSLKRALSVEAF